MPVREFGGEGAYNGGMTSWYYVLGRERIGPVDKGEIEKLYRFGPLKEDSHVWRKGFSGWEKLGSVEDFSSLFDIQELPPEPELPEPPKAPESAGGELRGRWENLDPNEKTIHVKIGYDRDGEEVEYGPYSLVQLKRAYGGKEDQ